MSAATLQSACKSGHARSRQSGPQASSDARIRKRAIESEDAPSLLARVAVGERNAVEECLDRFGGLVWSLARRACPNAADAEDAVQEIFTEVWTSAHRYDANVASETTFVAMIARRRLIDQQRKRGRRPRHETLEPATDQPTHPETSNLEIGEEVQRVEHAMQTLKPQQREALRLSIYENCSHSEIAQKLDQPLGTVKTNIRRGLLKVREMLGVEDGDTAEGGAK